jgi:hypothetical protein
MADDLNKIGRPGRAMAVVKMEAFRSPRLDHFNLGAHLPIVISRDDHDLTMKGEVLQKPGSFQRRSPVVNQIAEDDEAPRRIFTHQLHQPLGNREHSPHRDQATSRALAEFVPKMQISHGEPAFALMEKCEAAIEQDFIGDERLIRA